MSDNRMNTEERMEDTTLGILHIRRNTRAVRMTFRPAEDGLLITAPVRASVADIRKSVEQMRPRLEKMMQKFESRRTEITPEFRIENEFFTFYSQPDERKTPVARHTENGVVCLYPPGYSFQNEVFRKWIVGQIENALRRIATREFAPRLATLAAQRGLKYGRLSITKAKGRWGSCSTRRHISLSLYLVLLPRHLQDYVMQHELTHLLEMNHSPRFHARLDEALGGREQDCLRELKQFHIPF